MDAPDEPQSQARGRALLCLVFLACAAGACQEGRAEPRPAVVAGGDASRGLEAIEEFGCGACHTIPGVRGASATVGPPLSSWSRRAYIAGSLPNTPDNLVRWIMNPQAIEPGTVMPALGVSEQQARDVAAYLYGFE